MLTYIYPNVSDLNHQFPKAAFTLQSNWIQESKRSKVRIGSQYLEAISLIYLANL